MKETEKLTQEQADELLADCSIFIAIIEAYSSFCESIGKTMESKIYIAAFLKKMKEEPEHVNKAD